MSSKSTIRVLIADDHVTVREGLAAIIHRQPDMTFDTDNEVSQAIRAGARGYILKDAQREELLNTIRRVHAGETCIPPALVAKLAAGMSNEVLTGRELEVLTLLARGQGNRDIGLGLLISETTVKSHLRSIFAKLNVLSRTEAIAVATRRGLVRL
jgi:DNA-binding NarL/FixJ family response regulator